METVSETSEAVPRLTPARIADMVAEAIEETLLQADSVLARAADRLGHSGLRGPKAHARLQEVCHQLPWAATCSAIDEKGVLVSEAPVEFIRVEGRDLREQEHVRLLLQTQEPMLSGAFRSVEGVDAVILAHPVYGRDGRFLGSLSLLARPASLIGHAVKPLFPRDMPELSVMQRDGYLLYDTDRDRIGRNVLLDSEFKEFAGLQEVAKREAAEREGVAAYLDKHVHWRTATLHGTEWRVVAAESHTPGPPKVLRYDEPTLPIPAEVGLRSLIAIVDGYLRTLASELQLIATEPEVRTCHWSRVEAALRRVKALNPPGVYFLAAPDGSFWTVEQGRGTGSLSDRPYFRRGFEGDTIVGDLVVGKVMGRYEAVVAVPVRGEQDEVRGLLGATLYLDALSARIREDMGLGEGLWFYAFDESCRVALHPESERIFLTAGELGPEVVQWFTYMQARGEGEMRYSYEGRARTLVFRRSPLTGWMYAFGFLGARGEG